MYLLLRVPVMVVPDVDRIMHDNGLFTTRALTLTANPAYCGS